MIETVYRVRCAGSCGRYLRNGRPAPAHWGPQYAQTWPAAGEAHTAAEAAGWTPAPGALYGLLCPLCAQKEACK